MIRVYFDKNTDARVLAAIAVRKDAVIENLRRSMAALMFRLQRKVVTEKLSGQVLQHKSGKLAGSVSVEPVEVTATSITGRVTAATGPAWYGRVHERGGERSYIIVPRVKKALAWKGSGSNARDGKIFAKIVHHPPLPKRPFMGPALEEMRDTIVDTLKRAAGRAMKTGAAG